MHIKIVPHLVNNQDLAMLPPNTSVHEAAQTMAERHIGAVLVGEGDRLAGIFTERDVVTRVVAPGLDPHSTVLGSVMTPNPDTVEPNQSAFDALEQMARHGYRHLPVVTGGKLVGIVSIRDLYAAVKIELEEDLKQREAFIFDTGYGSG